MPCWTQIYSRSVNDVSRPVGNLPYCVRNSLKQSGQEVSRARLLRESANEVLADVYVNPPHRSGLFPVTLPC